MCIVKAAVNNLHKNLFCTSVKTTSFRQFQVSQTKALTSTQIRAFIFLLSHLTNSKTIIDTCEIRYVISKMY
jgi:hypothetical protein